MNGDEKLYFLSCCVEAYKMRHGMSGEAVFTLFDEKGVTQYLMEYYDVLHTQGEKWIVADIDEFIQKHQIKSTMSGKLTQDNLYLLLPGKVLAVAQMYARHHNVSVLDAMRIVYASDMYKQLEQESTKRWHEGPVSLYQTL